MRTGRKVDENFHQKQKIGFIFSTRVFVLTYSLKIGISFEQPIIIHYCRPFFLLLDLLCSIYNLSALNFYFFMGGFEVLKLQYFKFLSVSPLPALCVIFVCYNFNSLLVVVGL